MNSSATVKGYAYIVIGAALLGIALLYMVEAAASINQIIFGSAHAVAVPAVQLLVAGLLTYGGVRLFLSGAKLVRPH